MGHEWCIWSQLAFIAASTLLVRSLPVTSIVHCNASISANETCIVPYLSSVRLHCPMEVRSPVLVDFTSWWFGQKSVCGQPNCSIAMATSATTGVYHCRAGTQATYTVQLNVLAPPELLRVSTCVTPFSSSCKSPQPLITMQSPDMKATVSYTGTGNISVTWSRKPDTSGIFKPFRCTLPYCVLDTSRPNQQSIAIKINNPFQMDDIGIYMANVSNQYGYNTTVTILNITCDPKNPPQLPNPTKVIMNPITTKEGTNHSISCSAEMDSNTNLIMCYQSQGDNNSSSSDCGTCPAFTEGSCYPIKTKPHWKISSGRKYPLGPCKPQRSINATIYGVRPSDAGLVFCYWSSSVFKMTPYYSYNVSVIHDSLLSSPLPMALSQQPTTTMVASLTASVIGVLMACLLTAGIAMGCCFRRREVKPSASTIIEISQTYNCEAKRYSAPSLVSLSIHDLATSDV